MLICVVVGIHFINEPKLIYFSDPVNKPREESWAGLLFGGLALLAYLCIFEAKLFWIPALLCSLRHDWRSDRFWRRQPAAGNAVSRHRVVEVDALLEIHGVLVRIFVRSRTRNVCVALARSTFAARGRPRGSRRCEPAERFRMDRLTCCRRRRRAWRLLRMAVRGDPDVSADASCRREVSATAIRVLFGFTGMGCVLMLLSRRWPTVAWQTAISVTIMAAAIDWERNLLSRGNIEMRDLYRRAFMFGIGAISVLFVNWWQHRKHPKLMDLFLFATCILMGFGYLKGFARSEIWWPDAEAVAAAGGSAAFLWQKFDSEIVVHIIFTVLPPLPCGRPFESETASRIQWEASVG